MHELDQNNEESRVYRTIRPYLNIDGEVLIKVNNQKPDVLIQQENRIIGIELTEIKSKEPKNNGTQRKVARVVDEVIQRDFNTSFDILLFFNGTYLSANKVTQLAESIALIIKNNKGNLDGRIDCENEYLNALYVFPHVGKNSNNIHVVEAGPLNNQPAELIDEIISKKEKKIEGYLKNCNECWLIIYSNQMLEEGIFDFSGLINKKIVTRYEKVIVFDIIKPSEYVEIGKT